MGVQQLTTIQEAADELVGRALEKADSDPYGQTFTVSLEHEEFRMPIDVTTQEKLVALVDQKARDKNLKYTARGLRSFTFARL